MSQRLPPHAEAFLAALAPELWFLASDESEAVIAELRAHLAARAEAGALGEALAGLGSPAALAAAYDFAGVRHKIAPVPAALAGPGKKTVRELLRDARATLRAGRSGLAMVGGLLVTSLTATDYLLWLDVRLPSVAVAAGAVMAVRLAAVLLAFSAAYRLTLSPAERPWSIDRGFLAFCGALGLASALVVAAAMLAGRAASGES